MQTTGSPKRPRATPRSQRVRILIALGLVGVLGAVLAGGSAPVVCGACHGDQHDALDATAHADVGCYDCHLDNGAWGLAEQKSEELFRMYPAALFGRDMARPADTTSRDVCLGCHGDVSGTTTDGERFSIVHDSCASGPTCDTCHAPTAHGTAMRWQPGPVMEECVSCHSAEDAPISCDTCHAEGDYRRPTDAPRGPWQVTHGKHWEQTHGLGDTEVCVTCHPDDYCTRCHGVAVPHTEDFGSEHGTAAIESPDSCAKCHTSRTEFCDACHTMEMPHPDGFLPSHSQIASSRTEGRCFICHADRDCENCHAAHVHPGGGAGVPVPWNQTPEVLRP